MEKPLSINERKYIQEAIVIIFFQWLLYDLVLQNFLSSLYLLLSDWILHSIGTCTATAKFHALQQRVQQVLHNTPQPGPAIFIAHCLYVLPLFGSYSEGFSHLVISGLRRFLKSGSSQEDLLEARNVAAQLFLDIVAGFVNHDERIVIKVLEVFDVKLTNIEKVIGNSAMKNDSVLDAAKKFVEGYIHQLMDSRSYMTAVALIQQFSIQTAGQPFLLEMLQTRQFKAAEKYATHKGMDMLCLLVQEYVNMNMLKDAYDVIKKNNLRQEFPDIYHKCKERYLFNDSLPKAKSFLVSVCWDSWCSRFFPSLKVNGNAPKNCSSLKKLAEKGCWDIAEVKTNSDRQLIEYLVSSVRPDQHLSVHFLLLVLLRPILWMKAFFTVFPTNKFCWGALDHTSKLNNFSVETK